MDWKVIRENVGPGAEVKLILVTGQEIIGSLVEIEPEYVKIQSSETSTVILNKMIGGWEILSRQKEIRELEAADLHMDTPIAVPDETVIESETFDWKSEVHNKNKEHVNEPQNQTPSLEETSKHPPIFYILWGVSLLLILLFVFYFLIT